MRPPFLDLGGEDKFADYQAAFDRLLPSGFTDYLGNLVDYAPDRCHHVCFKQDNPRYSSGPRNQWRQDRAERLPWIRAALEEPAFICKGDPPMWLYLIAVKQDYTLGLLPELFCVVVDARDMKDKIVHFVTGYTINEAQWNEKKKNGEWIHPPKPYKPNKPKKKKA